MAYNVFISYAHKDREYLKDLEEHLSNLRRQGLINPWADGNITEGDEWRKAIEEHLEKDQIFLLLISPSFMASEFCYGIEMQRAIERHEAGQARVIPIIIRPVDWKDAPFAKLKALPLDGKAVAIWPDRDSAFLDVARGLRRVIEVMQKQDAQNPR